MELPIPKLSRSLSVPASKLAQLNQAVVRQGFDTQKNFAEALEMHPDTVRKFRKGKPISRLNFQTLCEALELDWGDWAFVDEEAVSLTGESLSEGGILDDAEEKEALEVLDVQVEDDERETAKEIQDIPPRKVGNHIVQNAHINHGLMIGNVQGNVSTGSSQ